MQDNTEVETVVIGSRWGRRCDGERDAMGMEMEMGMGMGGGGDGDGDGDGMGMEV